MNIEEIRTLQKAVPFEPFEIRMVDGRVFSVPHPDFILVPAIRHYTWVYVATPDDDAPEHLNTALISSLAFMKPGKKRRRKAS